METDRKKAVDQTKAQTDAQRNAIAADRNRVQEEGNQSRDRTTILRTVLDTRAAQDIAAMNLTKEGGGSHFSDGASLGGEVSIRRPALQAERHWLRLVPFCYVDVAAAVHEQASEPGSTSGRNELISLCPERRWAYPAAQI